MRMMMVCISIYVPAKEPYRNVYKYSRQRAVWIYIPAKVRSHENNDGMGWLRLVGLIK